MRKPFLLVLGSFFLAVFAPLASGQSQTVTYTYSGLPIQIYPNDWNTWSVISLFVPRSLLITNVSASVTVQYSGMGDLNLYMFSPYGTRTILLERNCGSLQNINTTFDDSGSTMFSQTCPAAGQGGPYKGNQPLGNSNNQNSFGYWRLAIENNGSSNTGFLTGFSVTITGTTVGPPVIGPNSIVSTSSVQSGAVAPGDQISLLGVNLGPTPGVSASLTQTLPTSLAGTTVTFDGTAVPIYFASNNLVAVQAPVTLSPQATTNIQVTSTNGASTAVPLPVVAARPGVFTYYTDGTGQARASNQDGSPNGDGTLVSSAKPAAAGSVISVYATGLGAVTPQVPQGTPAPASPLSMVNLPVTATIGGRSATVVYAGLAPGQVGVYQVNVTVPASVLSGPARLVLTAGNFSSQDGVTIQIQ